MASRQKFCPKCNKMLNRTDFYRHRRASDGLQHSCKTCTREINKRNYYANYEAYRETFNKYNKRRRTSFRDAAAEVKRRNTCVFCGENEPVALEFFRNNRTEERVARLICDTSSWKRISSEMRKCFVVCSTCRKKVMAGILKFPRCGKCKIPADIDGSVTSIG